MKPLVFRKAPEDTFLRSVTERQSHPLALGIAAVLGGLCGAWLHRTADGGFRSPGTRPLDENQLLSLVQQASDIISVLEPDGTIRYESPAVERVLGYSPDDLVGTNAFDLIHPDDLENIRRRYAEAVERVGHGQPVEIRLRHRDGNWRYLEVIATNLLDDAGVAGIVLNAHDVTERKVFEDELRHQALHDPLTGLPNRSLLLDRLRHALPAARAENRSMALLLMDLDRFKDVNDTFGHHYGDRLLRQLGPRIREELRNHDTIARLGGDEFAILLPEADAASAAEVAQRILAALEHPFDPETAPAAGHSFLVEGSIGVALFPDHGQEADTLLQHADVAMYLAKQSGEGYALYDPEQDEYCPQRLALIGELRRAIEQGQLILHYQPKINLATEQVEGVEALVRWQHPTRGFIPPDEFIPLAEHTGLIKPLSIWVLDRALRQCRRWHDEGFDIQVSVNLSARNLTDRLLAATVAGLLEARGVRPELLQVELTESAVMTDISRAIDSLTALKCMGVSIAIDDFGTGYTSLAQLKRLPIDQIKIDRTFVEGMERDAHDWRIVRATVDLGHDLGLRAVAEGVENREVCRLLARLGCDVVQGDCLSRPLSADECTAWMRRRKTAGSHGEAELADRQA